MRAGILAAPGRVELVDVARPVPAEGDILVRMEYGSICGSDVHVVYDGFHTPALLGKPGYPGHEGVGRVEVSRSERFAEGDLVLTVPIGRKGGCFADYQVVDEAHALKLPDSDPLRLLMAQQLGTTIFAMKRFWPAVPPAGSRTAVVLGCGSAGLFFVQLLRRAGFETVVAADVVPGRAQLAASLGAQHALTGTGEPLAAVVAEATDGRGAALVIEAAGYDGLRAEAVNLVEPGGVVGCYGFPESKSSAPFPVFDAFRKAVTAHWISGTQSEPGLPSFGEALELIHDGSVEVDYCLAEHYPLDDLALAFEHARRPEGSRVKAVIDLAGATA